MGSEVERRVTGLLVEWNQIVLRECAVELRLERVDKEVHQKFPDLVYDILKIGDRSSLERNESNLSDRNVLVEQWQIKIELDEIKLSRRKKEAQLQREADMYRASMVEGVPTKRTRTQ